MAGIHHGDQAALAFVANLDPALEQELREEGSAEALRQEGGEGVRTSLVVQRQKK